MDPEPNDTSSEALEIPLSETGQNDWTGDGLLDADDAVDSYRLTVPSSSLVLLNTEPQPGIGDFDTLMTLYSADGVVLAEDDDGGNSLWSRIAEPLEAGDYVVTIEPAGASSSFLAYRLRASLRPLRVIAESEPNDTDEETQAVDWGDGASVWVNASIGPAGDVDSYRITLPESTTLVAETGSEIGSSADFDTTISIYDEDLWEVAYNDDANGSWSRLEESLEAGTYYIVVQGYYDDETFPYTLLLTEFAEP
jgi:hypothetical protein